MGDDPSGTMDTGHEKEPDPNDPLEDLEGEPEAGDPDDIAAKKKRPGLRS